MSCVTGWICTPIQPRVTEPCSLSWVTTLLTVSAGIAKAMPTEPPDGEKIAVLTPITLPSVSNVGPARIALVHRRVDLDEVIIGAGADVAAARRDDAGGDGAAEAERIADREHPIADARRLIGQLHIGERPVLDLDQREIGARIGADHLGFVGLAVVGGHGDAFGFFDHVVVSHRIAVGGNEKAGSLASDDVMAVAFGQAVRIARHVGHAEPAEEIAQARRNVIAAKTGGLRSAVDLDAHRDHRRFDLLDDVGKADRRLQLVRLLGQILRERGRIAGRQIEAGGDDERGGAEADDGGGEEDEAARRQHARLRGGAGSGATLDVITKAPSQFEGRACAPFRT